jgi:predicted GTPase
VRLARDKFGHERIYSIGWEHLSFDVEDKENHRATVQLWDSLGCERFDYVQPHYAANADVALMCADSLATVERLDKWLELGRERWHGQMPRLIVVLTKSDLKVSEELRSAAKRFGAPVFEVSAMTGDGCRELKQDIINSAFDKLPMRRRRRAAEQACATLRILHRRSPCCFGGVHLPHDVLEHCIVPAVLKTCGEACWNKVAIGGRTNEPEKLGLLSSAVGWIKRGLGLGS